jgi:hypothetical protein
MKKIENNLRWFLFEEYLEMCNKSGFDVRPKVWNDLSEYTKIYKNPMVKIVLKGFRANYSLFSPLSLKKNEKRILFQNGINKYISIIDKASKRNAIVLGIKKSALCNFISKRTMYYPVFDNVYYDLNLGIINNNEDQLYKSLDKLKEVFEYLNPDVVVLNDDVLHPSRALILVSKELGVPTVEIQHGIYHSKGIVPPGKYSDYVFVWGEYFKNIYLDKKIRHSNTIKILGYPYEMEKIQHHKNSNTPKTVYYLSEDYESYDLKLMDIKIRNIKNLQDLCNNLGFTFVYRPHPSEDPLVLKSKLPHITVSSKRETLKTSFKKGDIFISFNSTALIEAKLYGKMCIQLKYYPVPTDDFEKLGICPSYNDIDEIEGYLKEMSEKKDSSQFQGSINSKYIKIPSPHPGTRFLELIDDMI